MNNEENDEVIVDDVEENNEEDGNAEEKHAKADKPKRTPQEELDYFEGRASRLRKQLGQKEEKVEPAKPTRTDKPNELDYGQLALLRTEGVKGSDEIALFKEIMAETGKDVLGVLDSNYFKARLTDFRENQASTDAIPKGKGRSGQSSVTDVDIAVAKFKESGVLPTDFATKTKVVNAMMEAERKPDFAFKK